MQALEPAVAENAPTAHGRQLDEPELLAYLPAEHAEHKLDAAPVPLK